MVHFEVIQRPVCQIVFQTIQKSKVRYGLGLSKINQGTCMDSMQYPLKVTKYSFIFFTLSKQSLLLLQNYFWGEHVYDTTYFGLSICIKNP